MKRERGGDEQATSNGWPKALDYQTRGIGDLAEQVDRLIASNSACIEHRNQRAKQQIDGYGQMPTVQVYCCTKSSRVEVASPRQIHQNCLELRCFKHRYLLKHLLGTKTMKTE